MSERSRPRRRVAAVLLVAVVLAGAAGLALRRHDAPHRQAPSTRHSRGSGTSRHSPRVRSIAAVPILMYHVIAPPFANSPYPGLYVPPREFAAQMRRLAAAGFRAVTLDQVRRAWLGRGRLPRKPIVVSFDNGYRTQFTHALPILKRLGWRGVENLQLAGLPPAQGGLSRRQVRGLVDAGWELDTQGWSHANLIALSSRELWFQVAHARAVLRDEYHVPVNWFCYPSGHYDARVIRAVRRAGFVGSTTVVPGWARPSDDLMRLPRLRVVNGTSPHALLDLVAGTEHIRGVPAVYPPGG